MKPFEVGSVWPARLLLLSGLLVAGQALAQKTGAAAETDPKRMSSEQRLKRIESIAEPFQNQSFLVDPVASRVASGFVAPDGAAAASGYVAAYRTAGNCVFWYEALSPETVVTAQWKGPPCKGQMVSGEGGLRVSAAKTEDGKSFIVQHEMMGKFSNGYLVGDGVKSNVLFNMDRSPTGEAYVLQGNFAHSTLSGAGVRFGKFPRGTGPSAIAYAGNFVNGQAHGLIERLSIGHSEGVKGDMFFLIFQNGAPLINQSRLAKEVEGYIHTARGEWKVAVMEWRDGRPQGSQISWAGNEARPHVSASCGQWQIEGALWKCASGSFALRELAGAVTLGAEATAFSVSTTSSQPVRLATAGQLRAHDAISADYKHTLSCDAELATCTGQANVPVGVTSPNYWSGDVSYRAGVLTPVGRGRFMRMAGETPQQILFAKRTPGDRVLAECERLVSPIDCARGSLKIDNVSYNGAYRMGGAQFGVEQAGDAPAYYRGKEGESGWIKYGGGNLDFGNGLVALVQFRDDKLVGVDDCAWPQQGAGSCSLQGDTVVFNGEREVVVRDRPRRESRSSSGSSSRSYSAPPPRFEPIDIPRRPTYVLPGMR